MKNKNNRKNINKKTTLYFLVAIVLLVAIIATWLYFKKDENQSTSQPKVNDVNYSAPTSEQTNAPTEQTVDNNVTNSSTPDKPAESVQIAITTARFEPDGSVLIRAIINSVDMSAKCKLSVTDNKKVIFSAEAGVQQQSNNSSCAGFSVPPSIVGDRNNIHISIVYTANQVTASADEDIQP